MNITESIAWQTVASLLRGEIDHGDESTRASVADACARLDQRAHAALKAGVVSAPQDWDEHLCHVATEER